MNLGKRFSLRMVAATSITAYYVTSHCDPFVSSTHKWNIRDVGLLKYHLGFYKEPEGFVSPTPTISPNLQKLIDEVKSKSNIEPSHLERINLVPLAQMMPGKTLGKVPGSAYAVIPDYLNVTSIDDLKAEKLAKLIDEYYGVKITLEEDWLSEEGKMIIKSFIMSDKAKKFLIARQLHSTENAPAVVKSFFVFATVMLYFIFMDAMFRVALPVGQTVKSMSNGKFAIISLTAMALVYMLWKLYNIQIDATHYTDSDARAITRGKLSFYDMNKLSKAIDKARFDIKEVSEDTIEKITSIDFEMVEGAVEYYSKLVTRHMALRDISKRRSKWFDLTHRRFTYDGRFKRKGFKLNFVPDPFKSLNHIKEWMNFIR